MPGIHSLACVDPAAQIADDVEIGPYCVIGSGVSIASGCRLVSHVHVEGRTTIGPRTIVYPHATLGAPPQFIGLRGGPVGLRIGADCCIRENVTMNGGTSDDSATAVGDRGFFMANAHVGHDCIVGDDVIFANCATLGGHCEIGDHVFIAGLAAIHQHGRVGPHAMIGALSGVRGDVIPFGLVNGSVARLIGINGVGMRRRDFGQATITAVRKAYRMLFFDVGRMEQRLDATEAALGSEPAVADIVRFIRTRSKRPLCRPARAGRE